MDEAKVRTASLIPLHSQKWQGGEEQRVEEQRKATADDADRLSCRMFPNMYPEVDDVVMVNVTKVADVGAYVTLLEYNDIEGMILRSEFSRRRIRSINKLIRIDRNEVVMVLRVDNEKGYIDLSKRRVSPEDVAKCEDRFNKAKAVHSVLRHVADILGLRLEELYEQVGWPLMRRHGSAYDAFKLMLQQEEEEQGEDVLAELNLTDEIRDTLKLHVRRRLAPQAVKIRADFEVRCFTEEGIDAIKEALTAGEIASTEDVAVKIRLVAPPMYVMTTVTLDKERGVEVLNASLRAISDTITERGGKADVKMAPKVVTLRDDTDLQAIMDRVRAENEELDGDVTEDS